MSKEERYVEHTVAWELPKCDSVTKGNYNLADIETKYMPIQTEVVSDSKDKIIADLQSQLAITEKALELAVDDKCFAENCIAESFIGKGAKVRVPKKEQWYLEKAKEMFKNEN